MPALLSVHDTIRQEHARWVVKDLTRLLEADAVLALIGEVLGLVPFKTDTANYNSIITNSQLHNEEPLWHNSAGWEFDGDSVGSRKARGAILFDCRQYTGIALAF